MDNIRWILYNWLWYLRRAMEKTQLMKAMIERCRDLILQHDNPGLDRPIPLRPKHLIWMCDRLLKQIDLWKATKLNRWIGFIQCAMIANGIIDLEQAKEMFERAKNAFGEPSQDLLDHLDPDKAFSFDIGGEG